MKITWIKKGALVLFVVLILCSVCMLGVFLGCKSQSLIIPENTPPRCMAYYNTLIAIMNSKKGFLTEGKKDFGLAGTWVIPCNDAFREEAELKLKEAELKKAKFNLEKIERCKAVYFKDKIVSRGDPEVYLKYVECLQ